MKDCCCYCCYETINIILTHLSFTQSALLFDRRSDNPWHPGRIHRDKLSNTIKEKLQFRIDRK